VQKYNEPGKFTTLIIFPPSYKTILFAIEVIASSRSVEQS
jgi:hypothetical protein